MKIITILFCLLTVSLHAAIIRGEIKLNYEKSAFDANVFKTEFGDTVKATTSWYAGEFFGEETVFAGVTVKNTGTTPMSYNYYVAFFDKNKKLVGTAAQGSVSSGLKPSQETQLGSCLIRLPKDKYKEILYYEAVIYEAEYVGKQ